jgi:hypothetical protein
MFSRADVLVVAALLSGGVLLNLTVEAPAIASLGAAVREHMQENQRALHQYTGKQRTELQFKGQVKNERVELVRFDAGGELQKTPLGGGPAPPSGAACAAASGVRSRQIPRNTSSG